MYVQVLESSIKDMQSSISSLNSAGSDILSQSSEPDSVLLSEKLDLLNRRWRDVCTEVADRKDRFDEHVPTTSEFADEMDELLFWLDETEGVLETGLRPADDLHLEGILEKIKVRKLLIRLLLTIFL